jgi:hypothetical protein
LRRGALEGFIDVQIGDHDLVRLGGSAGEHSLA